MTGKQHQQHCGPASIDVEQSLLAGERPFKGERQDAAIEGFLLQFRHGQLESGRFRVSLADRKGQRDSNEGALERRDRHGRVQTTRLLRERETGSTPAESWEGRDGLSGTGQ